MNKYGQEIDNLAQWADLAFRNGNYEEAELLNDAVSEWEHDIETGDNRFTEMERYADALAYGMGQIKNLLEDLRTDVQQASRLNRGEILARLTEAIQNFSEYI